MTQEQAFIDFAEWSDGGDIFYRPQDKIQFQRSLQAVVNDHLGLTVVADNEKILKHYYRLMISRLRGMQEFQLEVLLPSNTDTLLKRFNQIMASMPVDRALRPPDADTPVTLMVLNDAHLVGEEQWLLLSQLLSDFPGVNVRLIVFIDVTEWPRYEKPIKLFGRKLYQWKLEAPTSLESKDLLAAAQQNGFKVEVESLLRGLAIDIPKDTFDENDDSVAEATLPDAFASNGQNVKPIMAIRSDQFSHSEIHGTAGKTNKPSFLASAILLIFVLGALSVIMSVITPPIIKSQPTAIIYLNNNPSLRDTLLVSMNGSESEVHGLIPGPFNTEQAARDFIQSPGIPKDGWVRNTIFGPLR